MAISVDILDANAKLAELEKAIQQTEALPFRLISITIGVAGGKPASLVTFLKGAAAPAAPISLEVIDGALSKDQQQAHINGNGKTVVCYGSLYVQGQPQNVAAYR